MDKVAYLDCFAGVSGDMFLGAIVDAGIPLKDIEESLTALPVKGYKLEAKRVTRANIEATKVTVAIKNDKTVRRWKEIEHIINRSDLPDEIKEKGLRIFKGIFEAEGRVHGDTYERVHLHELGAIDCLVDVFGTLSGLHLLGVEKVYSSAVNLGSGTVKMEHGTMPIPAPAVIELLKGKPVYSSGPAFELTTPTGAAILREIVHDYGLLPPLRLLERGYGAGERDLEHFPNVLRILIGEEEKEDVKGDITVIETNIDDMNPQIYEYLFERLFEAGARDVFLTQVIMKKGRPGVILTVLCDEGKRADVTDILFRETTTLGIRFYKASRTTLHRELRTAHYRGEKVGIKVARYRGQERSSPEYEDCKKIAKEKGIPLIDVIKEVKVK